MQTLRGDHYDVLGIEPSASGDEVEEAFRRCLLLYGEGSLATYSLLEPEELAAVRARVYEAYNVLRDSDRRREYDSTARPVAAIEPEPPAIGEVRPERRVLPEPVTGADLKRVREERGVALKEIAKTSRIGVRFLEHIEADRHGQLPAIVYLRGFLQEYARAVGLDPLRTAGSSLARVPRR